MAYLLTLLLASIHLTYALYTGPAHGRLAQQEEVRVCTLQHRRFDRQGTHVLHQIGATDVNVRWSPSFAKALAYQQLQWQLLACSMKMLTLLPTKATTIDWSPNARHARYSQHFPHSASAVRPRKSTDMLPCSCLGPLFPWPGAVRVLLAACQGPGRRLRVMGISAQALRPRHRLRLH
jgi:hypothetical protein